MRWGPGYTPPSANAGHRIPVHKMRRFFNYMVDKCRGIEIAHRGEQYHVVSIHFDTSAEASGFYRSLQSLYALKSVPGGDE